MAHPCVEPVGGIDVEIKPPLQSKYFNPALLAGFVLKNLTQKHVGVDEGVGVFVGGFSWGNCWGGCICWGVSRCWARNYKITSLVILLKIKSVCT
jgi:hypothetical protein